MRRCDSNDGCLLYPPYLLAEAAHGICPYSKAVHGNIEVETTII
jgi:hypothetical protein